MNHDVIQITSEPIGVGQERACYQHPNDAGKVIKTQKGESYKQTLRELRLYKTLARRGMGNYEHIPRYYGLVETNLGKGFVVDKIADYDGELSRSLWWHFERGYPVSEFLPYLEELRQYLLDNQVMFSVDMGRFNVLFQRLSPTQARLVVIDGLGDHVAINWLDKFGWIARRKINRRWQRFIGRLCNYSADTMRAHDGNPRTLDAAYRKTG